MSAHQLHLLNCAQCTTMTYQVYHCIAPGRTNVLYHMYPAYRTICTHCTVPNALLTKVCFVNKNCKQNEVLLAMYQVHCWQKAVLFTKIVNKTYFCWQYIGYSTVGTVGTVHLVHVVQYMWYMWYIRVVHVCTVEWFTWYIIMIQWCA